jgi:hypothetical protein
MAMTMAMVMAMAQVFEIAIDEFDPVTGEWKAFGGSDVQLELIMIDPYIRTTLKSDGKGPYSARVQLPDVYGVYKVVVHYTKLGFSNLHVEEQVSIHPFRHDQFERFIDVAFPYYTAVRIHNTQHTARSTPPARSLCFGFTDLSARRLIHSSTRPLDRLSLVWRPFSCSECFSCTERLRRNRRARNSATHALSHALSRARGRQSAVRRFPATLTACAAPCAERSRS